MVLSDRSKKGEVMTMLTSRPDCLAPDSTAQAWRGDIVALFDVSTISSPYVRDGKVASGYSEGSFLIQMICLSFNIHLFTIHQTFGTF